MAHEDIAEAKHRLSVLEAGNTRMVNNMEAVVEKLETIIEVIRGNLKTPEVPGLMHRMTEMRTHQQVDAAALAETKALVVQLQKSFDNYKEVMPSASDLAKVKELTETQKSKYTFAMGWIGGMGWLLAALGGFIYWLKSVLK